MSCYIVIFELVNAGRNYSRVVDGIKAYGSWARLSPYTYLISTDSSPEQVRDYLIQFLINGDKLYTGRMNREAAWHSYDQDVSNWIQDNQY